MYTNVDLDHYLPPLHLDLNKEPTWNYTLLYLFYNVSITVSRIQYY